MAMACHFLRRGAQALAEVHGSGNGDDDYDDEDEEGSAGECEDMLGEGLLTAVQACGRRAWACHADLAEAVLEDMLRLHPGFQAMGAYQLLSSYLPA